MAPFELKVAEHFNGQIWRMEVDHTTSTLFAEVRNPTDRKVSFAAINLQTGKTNFKDRTLEESWLAGIETAYNGVLLVHYYQAAGSPTHKGLAGIDGATGQLLWHNFNNTFDHLTTSGPVVYDARMQPPAYHIIDVQNGTLSRSFAAATDVIPNNHIQLPVATTLPTGFAQLPVEPHLNIVHYLELNNLIIVSLHTFWAGQLRQYLYLLKDGLVIFEDILNTNIQKMQPEAFVLYQNQLIYLKDKVEIKVLNLS